MSKQNPQRHGVEHKLEMLRRSKRRDQFYTEFKDLMPNGFIPASVNRRTLLPHEHLREIARNNRRSK